MVCVWSWALTSQRLTRLVTLTHRAVMVSVVPAQTGAWWERETLEANSQALWW
jgi:hypothetical protein